MKAFLFWRLDCRFLYSLCCFTCCQCSLFILLGILNIHLSPAGFPASTDCIDTLGSCSLLQVSISAMLREWISVSRRLGGDVLDIFISSTGRPKILWMEHERSIECHGVVSVHLLIVSNLLVLSSCLWTYWRWSSRKRSLNTKLGHM